MKVIKVTKTYFELEDGTKYEHPIQLDAVPTLDEFQKMYDKWSDIILKEIREDK